MVKGYVTSSRRTLEVLRADLRDGAIVESAGGASVAASMRSIDVARGGQGGTSEIQQGEVRVEKDAIDLSPSTHPVASDCAL